MGALQFFNLLSYHGSFPFSYRARTPIKNCTKSASAKCGAATDFSNVGETFTVFFFVIALESSGDHYAFLEGDAEPFEVNDMKGSVETQGVLRCNESQGVLNKRNERNEIHATSHRKHH